MLCVCYDKDIHFEPRSNRFAHQRRQLNLVLGSRVLRRGYRCHWLLWGHHRKMLWRQCGWHRHNLRWRQHRAGVVGVVGELAAEILRRSALEQIARVVVLFVVDEHIAAIGFAAEAEAFFARAEIGAIEELAAHRLGGVGADDHVGFDVETDWKGEGY